MFTKSEPRRIPMERGRQAVGSRGIELSQEVTRNVRLAAFEAGVSPDEYVERALEGQLIADGWITAQDARGHVHSQIAERAV